MNCFSLNRVQQFEQLGESPVAMRPCGLLPGIGCNGIFPIVFCNLLMWFGLLLWPFLVSQFLRVRVRAAGGSLFDICTSGFRFPASFLCASPEVSSVRILSLFFGLSSLVRGDTVCAPCVSSHKTQ
ncbi:hypothetical protein DFH06DRAFT_1289870 [Mycena polygramma]|nr:hypothetical protein DFH06DRAFT_1289870 [Mycena polygramma]